jgi:SAM-dependent methyltransferase
LIWSPPLVFLLAASRNWAEMISVREQIEAGRLVCPQTKARLRRDGEFLIAETGTKYPVTGDNVPILLADVVQAEKYVRGSSRMLNEYSGDRMNVWESVTARLKAMLNKDYRTKASRDAYDKVVTASSNGELCLSIGGGPKRQSPNLTNLNIGPFPNVDVVADAHHLPYACTTVDAIYCEAVLEHLQDPATAVQEMFRVLKPGGKVIAITPFMQGFHGYPYHFQNFTFLGHASLFNRAGFSVLETGTCVGPTYTVVMIIGGFLVHYLPRIVGLPLGVLWKLFGALLTPLDLIVGRSEKAYVLASSTYVLAEKPNGAGPSQP